MTCDLLAMESPCYATSLRLRRHEQNDIQAWSASDGLRCPVAGAPGLSSKSWCLEAPLMPVHVRRYRSKLVRWNLRGDTRRTPRSKRRTHESHNRSLYCHYCRGPDRSPFGTTAIMTIKRTIVAFMCASLGS